MKVTVKAEFGQLRLADIHTIKESRGYILIHGVGKDTVKLKREAIIDLYVELTLDQVSQNATAR